MLALRAFHIPMVCWPLSFPDTMVHPWALYLPPWRPCVPQRMHRGAGAYTAYTANAVPLCWLVRYTMQHGRPSNNNFPINLISGAVSRRNEIMFTVSLFWHYLQNNIVQRIFEMIRFTSNKSHFYLHQQRSVALKYAKNALVAGAPPRTSLGELTTLPQTP